VGNSGYFDTPFRWTEQEGTISHAFSYISSLAVSADGSVIVGSEYTPAPASRRAFMWTAETGRISLQDALIFGGADLNGWTLDSASGISADGRTVVGTASGPGGQQAYVATIGAILEPSTRALSLFAVAALIVVATRKIWQSGLTRKESLVCSHSLT
jgi:hypothetical protein